MNELINAVETTLAEEERAIFLQAVDSLPDAKKAPKKERKSKKAAIVAVVDTTKPVSKYAAKRAHVGTVNVADVNPTITLEAPVAVSALEEVFSSLEADLLGDSAADLEQMTTLRNEAYILISKAKGINVRELEHKANKDAWNWRQDQPKEAARMIFNDITSPEKVRAGKADVLKAAFLELQDAFHQQGGDPMKKQKYEDLCLRIVLANPRMKELHEKNLVRAQEVMATLEAQRAEQESLYAQAADKFETANIIATLHGWPTTEKKSHMKGGDAKGN